MSQHPNNTRNYPYATDTGHYVKIIEDKGSDGVVIEFYNGSRVWTDQDGLTPA